MILLLAILLGLAAGPLIARAQQRDWSLPPFRGVWLVFVGFIPQFIAFYLPATRARLPAEWVSVALLGSQMILLVFCWMNRHMEVVWLMALGLGLNFIVIAANGGFMPISPQTAGRLAPTDWVSSLPMGSRYGLTKDILLPVSQTRLEWLCDRFTLPAWLPYKAAFSVGDVILSTGVFLLLATQGKLFPFYSKGLFHKEAKCYQPR